MKSIFWLMMHFNSLTIAECLRACTRLWAWRPRWHARRSRWTTCPSGSSTASSWWTSSSSSTPPQTSSSTSLLATLSETRYICSILVHKIFTTIKMFAVQKDFHLLEQWKQRGLLSFFDSWQKPLQQQVPKKEKKYQKRRRKKVPQSTSSSTSISPSNQIPRCASWKAEKLTFYQNDKMTRWKDDKMTRWQRWQDDKMTWCYDDMMLWWHDVMMTRC